VGASHSGSRTARFAFHVRLLPRRGPRAVARRRNTYTIGPGKGPHAGELICVDCGQHRWLSKRAADWLEFVVTRFGAPNTPIIVRTSSETASPDAGAARSFHAS
jgi:hypothetical protein